MKATWEPGLGDHLRTIWRYKWFILGGAIVVAEITFVLLSMVAERYDADASVRLTVRSETGLSLDQDRAEYASRVYAELAESPRLVGRAAELSGLDISERAASKRLDVEWANPAGFVDITASGPEGEEAAGLADGMAEAIVEAVDEDVSALGVSAEELGDGFTLSAEVVETAIPPGSPAAPSPLRDSIAAFVIALVVLAELVALWRPARGLLPLTRTAERVTDLVGVPCLTLTGDPEDRTRLALFAARHLSTKPAVLVVHCKGEPLPAASVRLAEAVASGGRRSLVIDGDAPDPVLHRRLGLPQGPGLAEVASGERSLADAVFAPAASSADVALLTSGGRDGTRTPLPGDGLLERLAADDQYDFIIVTLGAGVVPDGIAGAVAEIRQSTILVIDPERTKRRELSELVHGFGGQDDVVAVLLLSDAAASAETKRLAARWWNRKKSSGTQTKPISKAKAEENGASDQT